MKTFALVHGIVLAAALAGCTGGDADNQPAAAAPALTAERAVGLPASDAAERELLRRLATPEAARVFRQYNANNSRQIQDHLKDVYGASPDFKRDAGGAGRPLRDGVVGPVTLKWLTRFCRDYGIVAGDPGFERAVTASLEQVAAIARVHPDWVAILASAEFEDWIAGQPDPDRKRSLQQRRSGDASQVIALIELFLRAPAPAPAPQAVAPIELTFGYDPERTEKTDLAEVALRIGRLSGHLPEQERIFDEEVRGVLEGLYVPEATLALIKRHSEVDAYLVKDELLQRLRSEGLPEAAVIALQRLQGKEYADVEQFQEALREAAAAEDQLDAVERKLLAIVRGARTVRYQAPATLAASLAAGAKPDPAVAALFRGFEKVEYPTRALFDAALEWQVRRALAMCPELPPKTPDPRAPKGWQGKLDDPGLAALEALMPGQADSFDRIRQLRKRQGCQAVEQVEADVLVYQVTRFVAPRLDGEMDFDIHHSVPSPEPRTSDWAPDWCRCARPEQDGMAYGFYPLWLDAGERQIDFGALTRIGLYGATVDDAGALQGPPGMEALLVPDHLAKMMRAAHRHDVKVDWVVARSDWAKWRTLTARSKQEVLDALRRNIVALLARELPDAGQGMIRLASLYQDAGPTGGDGVALYFRGFPAADKDLFNGFATALYRQLDEMRPARRLSLVVDYDELGRPGPFAHRNLVDLIKEVNPIGTSFAASGRQMEQDIPILALIPEPTRDSKKALRTGIQNALQGADAARLQWALMPVVEYDGVGSAQLADDIVFAAANYRGIGFWPLAFAGTPGADGALSDRDANQLLRNFLQPFGDSANKISDRASYLCPHRLWLRWLFWGSLAVALGVGAVYFNCRGCNERLDNSDLYFVGMMALLALPLLTLAVLVVSDPLLTGYLKYTLALYGTGGIVAAALVSRYYFKKSRRKLP